MALTRIEHDCSTGKQAIEEMTEEEEAAHLRTQANAQAGQATADAAERERADALALLAGSDDPYHRAIALLHGG